MKCTHFLTLQRPQTIREAFARRWKAMLFDFKREFLITFCCHEIKIPESPKKNKFSKHKCDIDEDTNIKLTKLKKKTPSIYHQSTSSFSSLTTNNKSTEPYSNIQPVATGSSESASDTQPGAQLQATDAVSQNNYSSRERIDSSIQKVPDMVPTRLSPVSPYKISPKKPKFPMLVRPSPEMLMPDIELVTDDYSPYSTNDLSKM